MGELIQEVQERLRSQGGRMTSQRRLLLTILESLGEHPTAEELYLLARQRDQNLNLSTVYRTLRWLENEDLIRIRVFAEDRRQERFDAALPSEHHHFMCTSCRKVLEFDTNLFDSIKLQLQTQSGAKVQTGSIMLYGLCPDCSRELDELGSNAEGA